MSRTVYLIDSENVASHWVGHIKFASAQDRLIIFWSRNCKGLPFGALEQFLELYPKEQIEFVECYTGSNSMDFHIVAKLGQLVARAPKTHFVIVSEDTGYDAVINHLHDEGFSVVRLAGCKNLIQPPPAYELKPELVVTCKPDVQKSKPVAVSQQQNKQVTTPPPIVWGRLENGTPCKIGQEKKQAVEKLIKVFITEHPEVASYRKEVTEILSSTVYPSKRNSVIIYEQMIKLPGTKEAKMAAIYRSMKKELLPAIDNVICPS